MLLQFILLKLSRNDVPFFFPFANGSQSKRAKLLSTDTKYFFLIIEHVSFYDSIFMLSNFSPDFLS